MPSSTTDLQSSDSFSIAQVSSQTHPHSSPPHFKTPKKLTLIAKHTIFSLALTQNEKYLIADQGSRSIRVINVDTGDSYEEHIIGSKEKMSSPECVFSQHAIFCGTERAQPELALYKVTGQKLKLKHRVILKAEEKFTNEIMVSVQRIEDMIGDFERILCASSHRRVFLLHVTPKKLNLMREFDLSFTGQFRLQFGVKTLYSKGNFAVFYTDNYEKKNCVLKFLSFEDKEEGETFIYDI